MGFRAALPAMLLIVAACGDDAATTAAPPATEGTTTVVAGDTVAVIVGGVRWELPSVVCAGADGDLESLAAAAAGAERAIIDLVAARVSGWPTTTRAPAGEDAEFYVAVNRAGPVALTLGDLAGTTDAILASWAEFEAGYAPATDSPGRVTIIADRVSGWRATATGIVAGLPDACG
ncbi:MAG: hypothetical protein HZA58_09690 [Acidimicrobiia bacterium]|nr:hypothetical protein [Acidimicrobiia bacterium]